MVGAVIYPIFLDIAGHAGDEDGYWRLLYEDMAYDKFPFGVCVRNGTFCCFNKGREFSILLEGDAFLLYTQIHSLLKNEMGLLSENEKKKIKTDVIETAQAREEGKRQIKDSTLMMYVIREGKKFLIPDTILRRIFSLLIVGFMFKTILVKDVVFNDNHIERITGFQFLQNKIRISKNILNIKKMSVSDYQYNHPAPPPATTISSFWSKYIHSLASQSNPSKGGDV